MTALPDGMRLVDADDLTVVRALCAATLVAEARPTEIADLYVSRAAEPHRFVVLDGDDAVAAAAIRTRPDGTRTAHMDLIAVAPDAQRRGHGRRLVTAAQTWAADRGINTFCWGADAPVYAWPGIPDDYPAAVALARATGAQPSSEAINCTADLAMADLDTIEDEARLATDGIVIERLAADDLPRLVAWVDTFGGTWSAEISAAAARRPPACHIARRGDAYVGFACHGANRSDWFGPMGTADSERGRGIGAVLLRRCLADQRAEGLSEAQIAWVGPVDFYARTVGARVGRRFTLCRQELPR